MDAYLARRWCRRAIAASRIGNPAQRTVGDLQRAFLVAARQRGVQLVRNGASAHWIRLSAQSDGAPAACPSGGKMP